MKRKLGEICRIVSGSTPKTGIPEYWDGNLKWITPAELDDKSRTVNDTKRTITELGAIKTGLTPLPAGTVLLSSRAPIGKVAITGCEMYCNQGFKNLICSDLINNEYLYWFLKGKTQCLKSLGRGATFKEISKTIVADIEINLPDIEEQEKIVNCIKKIDSRLFMLRAEISRLDELIKARFVEMFGSTNNEQVKIAELVEQKISTAKKDFEGDAEIKYIDISSINNRRNTMTGFTKYKMSNAPSRARQHVQFGDIIISTVRPNLKNVAMVSMDSDNLVASSGFCVLRPKKCTSEFLMAIVCSDRFTDAMVNVVTGANYPAIKNSDVLNYCVPLPSEEQQRQFANFVTQVDKSKFTLQNNIISLMNLWYNINQYVCERTYGEA